MPVSKLASGLAAKTVSQHSSPCDLVLYGAWFCPFVQRVWIALEAKQIPYQYLEIDPYAKTPELLRVNPRGLVPALVHHGKCIYESSVILEYLEEAFPSSTPLLPPLAEPFDRAQHRIWVDFVGKKLVPDFYRLLQAQESDKQEAAKADFLSHLQQFEEALQGASVDGPFFAGPGLSLVDLAWAPWALRFDNTLRHYRGFELPPQLPRLQAWHQALLQQACVAATVSADEEMVCVYERYANNTASSEVALAINSGRALP